MATVESTSIVDRKVGITAAILIALGFISATVIAFWLAKGPSYEPGATPAGIEHGTTGK